MESQLANWTLNPGIPNKRIRGLIPNVTDFYTAKNLHHFGKLGCGQEVNGLCMSDLAHRHAYTWIAKRRGHGYYLVAEDDVSFTPGWHDKWLEWAPSVPAGWRMIRLGWNGGSNVEEDRVGDSHWLRVVRIHGEKSRRNYEGAHAIVLTPRKARLLLEIQNKWPALAADMWTNIQHTYVTDEPLVQSAHFSSSRLTGKASHLLKQ